ncbi:glycosyltransferase [Pseudoalteromonas xiamenensis]|uniref:glycosyltransferase n=1 Tax=Pseudoalteromonas xiamenensis TaxID=882626 RepID=UPI0035E701E2
MNSILSVVLPTFRRPDFLDFFIQTHYKIFLTYDVNLCVSNNGACQETLSVLKKWEHDFPLLKYVNLDHEVNSDENILSAISMSKSNYTWLIGDSYEIPELTLKSVLDVIKKGENFNFIITNLVDRYHHNSEDVYDEPSRVFTEMGIISACIACNIYKTSDFRPELFRGYIGTDFSVLGYLLSWIGEHPFKLKYLENASVVTLKTPVRKVGWPHRFFEIMFINWLKFVDSLPLSYSIEDKERVKRFLITQSGIITWRSVLNLRATGWLTKKAISQHRDEILRYGDAYLFHYMKFLTAVPTSLCKALIILIETFRRQRFRLVRYCNRLLNRG